MSWMVDRKHGCRMQMYERLGLRHLVLENSLVRVTLLPDKGSDIVEFRLKRLDLDVMWASPTGIQDPRTTLSSSDAGGSFMDFYEGGWQEILPSGGPPSAHAGATWGQHGESATLPWDVRVVEDSADQVAVELRVRLLRYPISVHKTLHLRAESTVLEIAETVTNEADEPVELMWGHHPAVGAPFLSATTRFYLPGGVVQVPEKVIFDRQRAEPGASGAWPLIRGRDGGMLDLSHMPAPETRTAEMLYVTEMPEGWYAIADDATGAGFGLSWDISVFPYLWYWQVARGSYGYPWYGRTYSMALEPFSSWPGQGLGAAVAQGRAMHLEAGERKSTALHAMVWEGHGRVTRVSAAGVELGAKKE